jgi:CelD/BcsL family acetyltransferase involved in cellulose biosynthesis
VITHVSALRALVPAWWALLDRAARPQPTQTPTWLLTWWDVFGGGRELRVVVVETAAGEVIGIVPLLRRWVVRDGIAPAATLELLGSGEDEADEIFSEYIGAIAARGREDEVARAFVDALCSERPDDWDELRMPAMASDDPMVAPIAFALSARSAAHEIRSTYECPYIELPATWDEYLAKLGGDRRYFVRRTLRDLEAWGGPGGVALRRAGDEAELARGWSILRELHAERWQSPGVFGSARFRRFHEAVMPRLLRGEGGTLDLFWLEVRGEPVAATYNVVYRGAVQFYQSGRKLDVPKNVRPGIAMQLLAIRRAIESGHRTYDFLAHASQYKQQLAPDRARGLVTLTAASPSFRARASNGVHRAGRRIIDLARSLYLRSAAAREVLRAAMG